MTEPADGVLPTRSASQARADGVIAVLAGFLGWTFDAFDYFLVTLCSKNIAATLGATKEQMSYVISATLLTRPIGALVFGLLADRYGRRRPLMINLIFYSTISILSGLAPGFTLFFICRLLFGIGMGGEWGVGASLALEKVPVKWRGLISGFLQEGYAFGLLLSSAAYLLLFPLFEHWKPGNGWRPLFVLGGLPAILSLLIRSRVKESEVWEKTRVSNWASLGSSLISHWPIFLGITAVMLMMNFSSHGSQDKFPDLLVDKWHFGTNGKAGLNAIGAVGAIIGGILVGGLSTRFGRRLSMVICLLLAAATVPLWAFAPSLPWLIVGTFMIQFFVQGAWGVVPAYITEMSPDNVRGVLPGFAYQCGVAMSGSIVVLQTRLERHMSLAQSMASTAEVVFVVGAIVIGFSRERRNVVFGAGAD